VSADAERERRLRALRDTEARRRADAERLNKQADNPRSPR
jgi:hypothetical protein